MCMSSVLLSKSILTGSSAIRRNAKPVLIHPGCKIVDRGFKRSKTRAQGNPQHLAQTKRRRQMCQVSRGLLGGRLGRGISRAQSEEEAGGVPNTSD